jgi:hypothetical protein
MNAVQSTEYPTSIPLFGTAGDRYGWRLGANIGYVGQGMIMGPRVCFSMIAGSIVGFAFLAPTAVRKGWASEDAHSPDGCVAWVSWVAMSIMIADSLTSLTVLMARYTAKAASQSLSWMYPLRRVPDLPVAGSLDDSTVFLAASGALGCHLGIWLRKVDAHTHSHTHLMLHTAHLIKHANSWKLSDGVVHAFLGPGWFAAPVRVVHISRICAVARHRPPISCLEVTYRIQCSVTCRA